MLVDPIMLTAIWLVPTIILFGSAARPDDSSVLFKWREQGHTSTSDRNNSHATLSTTRPRLAPGELLELELICEFSTAKNVYNPFFDDSIPLPGQLVIFNARHEFVATLLPPRRPEQATPTAKAWVAVDGGPESLGTTFQLALGPDPRPPLRGASSKKKSLYLDSNFRAGKYFAQAVYDPCFEFPRPGSKSGEMDESQTTRWRESIRRHDAFRSNIVPFEVVRE